MSKQTANSGTAPTAPLPSGTASGDFLIAQVSSRAGSGVTFTAATNWTLIRKDSDSSLTSALYWRVAGVSEPTPTWGLSAFNGWAVKIFRSPTAINTSTPVDTSNFGVNGGTTSQNIIAASVTTANANEILMGFFCTPSTDTYTVPSGMTDLEQSSFAGGPLGGDICWQSIATASATGTRTAVASVTTARAIGQLVALIHS